MLTKEQIKEYQEIYKKEFKKEISFKEASEQGTRLVNLIELLHKIDHEKK